MKRVYLDHNATTQPRPEVIAAVADALTHHGNPSSVHADGRRAKHRVDAARQALARAVNAKPQEIIFTSGGTEANNLALKGLGRRRLLWGATEHDSVRAVAAAWDGPKAEIPVGPDGRIVLDDLAALLAQSDEPTLIAVMLANNETGVVHPISDIVTIAKDHGALLHVDAVQALGKIPVDFRALDIDSMSVSAHKLGGPPGVGALIVREGKTIASLVSGGGQEMRRRAGTENLPGIAGFGVAVDLATPTDFTAIAVLRDQLEAKITEVAPDAVIVARDADRLPNTSAIVMPGVASHTQVMALDLAGVAISAGSACSSGKVAQSHVLTAMGIGDDLAGCAIRVSLGRQTTADDVAQFVAAWFALYQKTRDQKIGTRAVS